MYYDNKQINLVGMGMIILAAITEAMIYFIVRRLKTSNPWNHVFISYVMGAILFSVFVKDIQKLKTTTTFISVIINAIIGLVGYLLRFYATTRLPPIVFSFLSYFGIIMAFIYGIIFSQESITFLKILSTILILIPSIQQKLLSS
jgi:drug/metabolite transporter (DMT)-like permease